MTLLFSQQKKRKTPEPNFLQQCSFFPVTKMAWKLCLIASLAFINGISAEAEAEADPQYFQLGNRLGKLNRFGNRRVIQSANLYLFAS